MRIALLDLNHITRGVHNNTVPLGLGLISAYLRHNIDSDFEVRIFKDAEKALGELKEWNPRVLGIAQYCWNSKLNLSVSKEVKDSNSGCLIVAGGPNLDILEEGRVKFFKEHPFVDICVEYDGEIPFCEIIKLLLSGLDNAAIRKSLVAGTYSFDHDKNKIIHSREKAPRLKSLDAFGALYADGCFDELLNDGYHPFLQTHRGCPFTCAFCHTSDPYYSKMLFLSPEIFRQDMEYLGRRYSGRHDVVLYMANTNMSLFEQDFIIAGIIRQIQDKYDWPRIISVNSGKDPKKLLRMFSVIKFQPGIALQTLTPAVLKNIKRINIPFEEFVYFQREVLKRTGETSATELILCLPGETKESFLATLKQVLNSGVQNIVIYTLMNLKGTPLSSPELAKKYGYIIRHRVVPRQFSCINGKKILDTEEVVVGTNSMPFKDYLELRGFAFTITAFFSSTELIPLKRLLAEYRLDLSKWIFAIHENLSKYPELESLYEKFMQDTRNELFVDRTSLIEFFEKQENFAALISGEYGDNLLRKYKCLLITRHYQELLQLAITEAGKLLSALVGEAKSKVLLDDMFKFLSVRQVQGIFDEPNVTSEKKLQLHYDLPDWLSSERGGIENYYGSFEYKLEFDEGLLAKTKDFVMMNKDKELSLQMLYRDGNIRDFWPRLEKVK